MLRVCQSQLHVEGLPPKLYRFIECSKDSHTRNKGGKPPRYFGLKYRAAILENGRQLVKSSTSALASLLIYGTFYIR